MPSTPRPVTGGSIAIGYPLGATGARLVLTVAHELRRSGGRSGAATQCIGAGMGISTIIESLDNRSAVLSGEQETAGAWRSRRFSITSCRVPARRVGSVNPTSATADGMAAIEDCVRAIGRATVTPLVRRALGHEAAEVIVERQVAIAHFLLDRAEEARELM